MSWPHHYVIPIQLSRAELYWLAALFLAWAFKQHQYEEFTRDFWARYNTPAFRRLQAVATRESPFLRRVRENAG